MGVVDSIGNRLVCFTRNGRRRTVRSRSVFTLHDGLEQVVDVLTDEAAIEDVCEQNAESTLKLGEARAWFFWCRRVSVCRSANTTMPAWKKSVVGTGGATKDQVQSMVRTLLPDARLPSADAADALAVAICHAHRASVNRIWERAAGMGVIARLKGILEDNLDDRVIVDVGGVGYGAYCSAGRLPGCGSGEAVQLEIEMHVRETTVISTDYDPAERDWFRLLTTVQGVGARVALAICRRCRRMIWLRRSPPDRAAISRANGVGPKVAGRIVTELKEKAGGIAFVPTAAAAASAPRQPDVVEDAVSALINLGYSRTEAFGAVAQAGGRLEGAPDIGALIKGGLAELSQ